ncbi:response regulator [Kordiimonas lacus]|uniref:histidine kinase n=1 Tax=Kordiimonas lacus TaxID=637679 RepID=A0A1G7DIL3_9PROT|nr:response regulator [Kordiimonas lacus]SDE51397.1 Signal transduction histidine kinase [Kordiimonas lacus]
MRARYMLKARTRHTETPLDSSRQLTRRYVVALLLVATAATTGFLTLYFSIKREETAATVINVAGRQRMLSQRIALFINQLQAQPNDATLQQKTSKTIDLFETSHRGLILGDADLDLPSLTHVPTRDIYFGDIALDERTRTFISLARTALSQAIASGIIDADVLEDINTDAAGPLLNALDSAVASFARESRSAIQNLETIEATVFIFTLLLLLAEAFVIFRPAVKRVQLAMYRVLKAEEASHKSARDRQLVLDAVSHELRTPLGEIMHAVASIPPEKVGPEVMEQLSRINRGCDDIANSVTAVLNYVSLETSMNAPRPEPINLYVFLDGLVERLAPQARAKNLVLYHQSDDAAAPNDWFIKVDKGILSAIVTKLLHNAIQYTTEGRVIVRSQLTEKDADWLSLKIDVADTGQGIPQGELDTIFDAFEAAARTGQTARGLGLGLSYARAATKQLGGTLTAVSTRGLGSTFSVTIPVEKAKKPDTTPVNLDETAQDKSAGLKCLVAEDNPVNQIILSRLLEREGHHVVSVDNGKSAVSEAARMRFDVILLDINMPEMRGDEACRAILEQAGDHTPPRMVAVTANTLPEQIAGYHAAGFQAVVGKPIDNEKLYDALVGLRPVGQEVTNIDL